MIIQAGDKVGTIGAIIATMGCTVCFPALAGIGQPAIGLGFVKVSKVLLTGQINGHLGYCDKRSICLVIIGQIKSLYFRFS